MSIHVYSNHKAINITNPAPPAFRRLKALRLLQDLPCRAVQLQLRRQVALDAPQAPQPPQRRGFGHRRGRRRAAQLEGARRAPGEAVRVRACLIAAGAWSTMLATFFVCSGVAQKLGENGDGMNPFGAVSVPINRATTSI